MDPGIVLLIGVVLIGILYAIGYFYPVTHAFTKKYGLKIALLLLTFLGGVVVAIMFQGRKKTSDIPLVDATLKTAQAGIKEIELKQEIDLRKADKKYEKEKEKHAEIEKEIKESRALPANDRLEKLAKLSKKVYG